MHKPYDRLSKACSKSNLIDLQFLKMSMFHFRRSSKMKITCAVFFVHLLTSFSTGVTASRPGGYCYVSCPTGQNTVLGRTCYTYVPERVTGSQAEYGCVQLGSHLVSINSQQEQDFVFEFWQDSLVAHTPVSKYDIDLYLGIHV